MRIRIHGNHMKIESVGGQQLEKSRKEEKVVQLMVIEQATKAQELDKTGQIYLSLLNS